MTLKAGGSIPVGIWCQNDVVLTSMRRDDVASTSIQRHFDTKCPLGFFSHIEPVPGCHAPVLPCLVT